MKKHITLVLVLLIGTCLMAQTPVQPSGSGTEVNPYLVETLSHLLWVSSWGGYAIQQNDIDASETSTWYPDGEGGYYGWPLVTYSGSYYGQGFEISGLYINRESSDNVGLFGSATAPGISTAVISGVRLTNANISGSEDVGGIVGISVRYNISKCYTDGSINGDSNVGGIAGRYHAEFGTPVTMSECYSSASISGQGPLGGLVGATIGATSGIANVTNCYADGSVNASSSSLGGGFIGWIEKSALTFCYSRGEVLNGNGFIGTTDAGAEGGSTVDYSYWDYEASGQFMSADGDFRSTSQMTTQSNYVSWDFTDTWLIDGSINDGYPYLQNNLPEDALPITLTEFSAVINNGSVVLSWNTASETDNACFLIYRDAAVIARLEGAGTSSEPHDYSYTDDQVVPGHTYTYMLADVSYANDEVIHENYAVNVTLDESDIPTRIRPRSQLSQSL